MTNFMISKNRKIINATCAEYDGITFRSTTERNMYKKLISLGMTPKYEPDTFCLWNGFRPTKQWYIDGIPQNTKKKNPITGKMDVLTDKPQSFEDWNYTPDFKLTKNGYTVYIEVKGYPNDLWPYKRKLFLKLLETYPNTHFFEVKTIKGLVKCVEIISKLWEPSIT